jgi:rhodanese-related sulfurtransferase
MTHYIDASALKAWLSEKEEIALLDVREHGQYGEGHLFFAISLPYSRFELSLPALVPNLRVRLVLYDDGDGVADRAATRACELGYNKVYVLDGGANSWRCAGYTLYAGVNVMSKAFGELVEQVRLTPRLTPQAVQAMRDANENVVIVDGRPFAEYCKMNIPGGICCPNGELVLRIRDIVPDPTTKIIINCAGRTRSIIGAQTLTDFGVVNPVYALENGTQGWSLAGFDLEYRATRRYPDTIKAGDVIELRARARELAKARGVSFLTPSEAIAWLDRSSRTTYLLDVRTPEEFAANAVPGFLHAPGGQLIQATDHWVGVRGARLILLDEEEVRAPVVACWLRQLGHDACVLAGGVAAGAKFAWPQRESAFDGSTLMTIAPKEIENAINAGSLQIIDLRASMSYRKGHIPQAVWSIRPRIVAAAGDPMNKSVVLVADELGIASLAALDLGTSGFKDTRLLAGGHEAWQAAGLPVTATPHTPADRDCIDFLFFTHGRHDGDTEASRQYLAWEMGLLDQLDEQERSWFRIDTDL